MYEFSFRKSQSTAFRAVLCVAFRSLFPGREWKMRDGLQSLCEHLSGAAMPLRRLQLVSCGLGPPEIASLSVAGL